MKKKIKDETVFGSREVTADISELDGRTTNYLCRLLERTPSLWTGDGRIDMKRLWMELHTRRSLNFRNYGRNTRDILKAWVLKHNDNIRDMHMGEGLGEASIEQKIKYHSSVCPHCDKTIWVSDREPKQ